MSSPYPVLDDKPIDQMKVTELKEELKKRKLATKGLKDDLIRRLDEALRAERDVSKEDEVSDEDSGKEEDATPNEKGSEKDKEAVQGEKVTEKEDVAHDEMDTEKKEGAELNEGDIAMEDVVQEEKVSAKEEVVHKEEDSTKEKEEISAKKEVVHKEENSAKENGLDFEAKPEFKGEAVGTPVAAATKVQDGSKTEKLDTNVSADDVDVKESKVTIDTIEVVSHTTVVTGSVETNITESMSKVTVTSSGLEPQNNDEIMVGKEDSVPPCEDAELNDSEPNNQVSEVSPSLGFQVKSDSISTDSVSINEKNELKDNLNADNFHIEPHNVKPEMVQPSSSGVALNGGDTHPLDDQEPFKNQGSVEEIDDINATNVDLSKKNDSGDGGSSEKLNLDRSSGDDSMEEDVMESKQVESNHIGEVEEKSESIKDHVMEERNPVDATRVGSSPGMEDMSTKNSKVAVPAEKRKLEDQEVVKNNEPPKRRRWNTETVKVPEPQSPNLTPSTTPKFAKRNFNRSDSTLSGGDTPKERVVPPSTKSPTTSLKIDRFLRPFTLKAVQELLGKTGSVSSFWMDHIKTHCYVTFESIEEAVKTRDAVYDLQWPPNGGRRLIAEFVDPQEVKQRAEAPPQPLVIPVKQPPPPPSPISPPAPSPSPAPSRTQPSPRLKQPLPPPPALPPPPPLSDPHIVRERLPLPPPPPMKKPDPPIVTLDDLFKKTKATPRIYYLPLSEEQVAVKLAAQGKITN